MVAKMEAAPKQASNTDIIRMNWHSLEKMAANIRELSSKTQVLIFGETHDNEKMNQYIANMLPDLKKNGYTHLVMEIDKNYQNDINSYLDGTISLSKLKERVPLVCSYAYDAYLIKQCKKNGIKVLCADYSDSKGRDSKGRWTDEQRFQYIRENIPPDTKFIVDYGAQHTMYNIVQNPNYKSLGQLFKESYGTGAVSIKFVNAGMNPTYEFNIEEEGGFFTSLMGNKLMDSGPSRYEKVYFKDYDLILNIKTEGTLSKTQLSKLIPVKRTDLFA